MTDWYSFTPQDTLYFRGAEPANMGENHTASMIFPPPAHTIAGALRTAVLVQNDIAFADYNSRKCPTEIIDAIGNSGEDSPFDILGPFFSCGDHLWIPCPFIWFSTKNGKTNAESKLRKIVVSAPIKKTSLVNTASGEQLFWAQGNDLESLGGDWVCIDEICTATTEKRIKSSGDLFVSEIHTGIALDVKDKRRTAREGHLYSFVHARLCAGVKLVFGATRELPMKDSGVLKLGAEQRFGEYRKIGNVALPQSTSGLYMTLSILAGNEVANRHCVATGRIRYYGGWDLHKGFHKPMKGFFPAGSVFDKKINDNCIEL
ncbi:MAG: type III-B CRISPR module-associated Cmr3 family protein [Syntrophales bacterium]|nr:type III-B CRISPR module-associated Cmr3 family protein [Syntrophales bacterium]